MNRYIENLIRKVEVNSRKLTRRGFFGLLVISLLVSAGYWYLPKAVTISDEMDSYLFYGVVSLWIVCGLYVFVGVLNLRRINQSENVFFHFLNALDFSPLDNTPQDKEKSRNKSPLLLDDTQHRIAEQRSFIAMNKRFLVIASLLIVSMLVVVLPSLLGFLVKLSIFTVIAIVFGMLLLVLWINGRLNIAFIDNIKNKLVALKSIVQSKYRGIKKHARFVTCVVLVLAVGFYFLAREKNWNFTLLNNSTGLKNASVEVRTTPTPFPQFTPQVIVEPTAEPEPFGEVLQPSVIYDVDEVNELRGNIAAETHSLRNIIVEVFNTFTGITTDAYNNPDVKYVDWNLIVENNEESQDHSHNDLAGLNAFVAEWADDFRRRLDDVFSQDSQGVVLNEESHNLYTQQTRLLHQAMNDLFELAVALQSLNDQHPNWHLASQRLHIYNNTAFQYNKVVNDNANLGGALLPIFDTSETSFVKVLEEIYKRENRVVITEPAPVQPAVPVIANPIFELEQAAGLGTPSATSQDSETPMPTPTPVQYGVAGPAACEFPIGGNARYLDVDLVDTNGDGDVEAIPLPASGGIEKAVTLMMKEPAMYIGNIQGCGHVVAFYLNDAQPTWFLLERPPGVNPGECMIANYFEAGDPFDNRIYRADCNTGEKGVQIFPANETVTTFDPVCDTSSTSFLSGIGTGWSLNGIYDSGRGVRARWFVCSSGQYRIDLEGYGWYLSDTVPSNIPQNTWYRTVQANGQWVAIVAQ